MYPLMGKSDPARLYPLNHVQNSINQMEIVFLMLLKFGLGFRNNLSLIWSICMHNTHHIFKKIVINHFFFTNYPLPQLLSLSRMPAWKLFRKHQMFSNWICFSSRRRSGPRRTRSAASEELVTSLSLRWKPNDTCPSLTSLSWHLWELVKFSEDLFWELGNHLWVQKVTSLGSQVKSSENGKRPPCHINSYQWHLPSDNQLICDSRLSPWQKSLASHVFLSAVCDSHFQFLSTFFTFNLIPPQLVSFMVRLEQNSLCLVFERMWGLANKEPSGASWHQVDPLGKQTRHQTWKPRLIPDTLSKSKVNIDDWRTKQRTT